MEVMEVPAARQGSIEAVLHKENAGGCYILFSEEEYGLYKMAIPHRAIGVVYDPLREKYGNYVPSILSRRYDAFIFLDETKALHPLHLHPDRHKLPETYPFSV
jgi:erythromycin esterase-like protein